MSQFGVLSPLCILVADTLLTMLNVQGMYAQGYTDEIAIHVRGKHMNTYLQLMQRALLIVERRCNEGLRVKFYGASC